MFDYSKAKWTKVDLVVVWMMQIEITLTQFVTNKNSIPFSYKPLKSCHHFVISAMLLIPIFGVLDLTRFVNGTNE